MATGDLTTVAAVKAQLETSATSADAVIADLVTAASAAIRTWTSREFAGPDDETRSFDVDGYAARSRFGLRIGDLRSAPTEVTFLDRTGVGTLDPLTDLEYLPLVRRLGVDPITNLRTSGAAPFGFGSGVLQVRGDWGWPAVPEDVEQAAIVTVRSWLRQDSNRWANMYEGDDGRIIAPTPEGGFMLPVAARQLLANYRLRGIA